MKNTSVPEQAIFFYTKKYLDENAGNNRLRIERYVADVDFEYDGEKYAVEYDSYSHHHDKEKEEKDRKKDLLFSEHGYKTIRFRDANLPFLETTNVNIRMIFDNYTKKMLKSASDAINEYLKLFDVQETIDVKEDLNVIRKMYNDY